jgi:hypothetical protein
MVTSSGISGAPAEPSACLFITLTQKRVRPPVWIIPVLHAELASVRALLVRTADYSGRNTERRLHKSTRHHGVYTGGIRPANGRHRHTGRKRLRIEISYTTTDTSELWCTSRKRLGNHSSYADRGAIHCDTTHNCGKTGQKEKEIWSYKPNTQYNKTLSGPFEATSRNFSPVSIPKTQHNHCMLRTHFFGATHPPIRVLPCLQGVRRGNPK